MMSGKPTGKTEKGENGHPCPLLWSQDGALRSRQLEVTGDSRAAISERWWELEWGPKVRRGEEVKSGMQQKHL